MTLLALALVVAAAFVHATWNYFAKRVGGGPPFVWLFGAVAAVLYAPLAAAVIAWQRPPLGPAAIGMIAGSAVLHLAYFLVLQRGYRVGDLSVVYPLARGTGPTFSTAAAILLFGERPTWLALGGAALIIGGVFLLAGGPSALRRAASPAGQPGVVFGVATGLIIAAYTLWDKQAVSAFLIPPLVLDWAGSVARMVLLAPVAAARRGEVARLWRTHRRETLVVAALNPLSYILILTALTFSPVSYIAPAREVSILIGALMGTRLLAEGDAPRRLAAASLIVLGVTALALG